MQRSAELPALERRHEVRHEFRDPELAKGCPARLGELAGRTVATKACPLHLMEICGGTPTPSSATASTSSCRTRSSSSMAPDVPSGAAMGRVDDCIDIAEREGVTSPPSRRMRVPARGRACYRRRPTAPTSASSTLRSTRWRSPAGIRIGRSSSSARLREHDALDGDDRFAGGQGRRRQFLAFCNPHHGAAADQALLDDRDMRARRLRGPGHVSMVVGRDPTISSRGLPQAHRGRGLRAARPSCNPS